MDWIVCYHKYKLWWYIRRKHFSFVLFVAVMGINVSYLLNAHAWGPKIKWTPRASIRSFNGNSNFPRSIRSHPVPSRPVSSRVTRNCNWQNSNFENCHNTDWNTANNCLKHNKGIDDTANTKGVTDGLKKKKTDCNWGFWELVIILTYVYKLDALSLMH